MKIRTLTQAVGLIALGLPHIIAPSAVWAATTVRAASANASEPSSAVSVVATATNAAATKDLELVRNAPGVLGVYPVFSPNEQHFLQSLGRSGLARAVRVDLRDEHSEPAFAAWVEKKGLQIKLEPRSVSFTALQDIASPNMRALRGASFESLQWGLKNVGQDVPVALDDLTSLIVPGRKGEDLGITGAPGENMSSSRQVRIAVLDTGIDFAHPELLDRVVENTPECRALAEYSKCLKDADGTANTTARASAKASCDRKFKNTDNDGNGYPLDCSGWNMTAKSAPDSLVWGDNDAKDTIGHGTHVAGVIAARNDDSDGIRGISENVRILAVKVLSSSPTSPARPASIESPVPLPDESVLKTGKGFGDLVARGLLYALRSNAQIINMSLGWPAEVDSNLLSQLLELAHDRGVLVVAASGNDGTDALIRPCIYPNVICVASHDPDGALSHFSNHGPGVDVAAPGMGILSLFPTALTPSVFTDRVGYEIKSGTSMASPAVAGVLARLLNAGISSREAYARLLIGTRPVSANPRVIRGTPAFVQTGSVDLARAFKVKPQPMIVPATKRPIEIKWNRRDAKVKFDIPLENIWLGADATEIQVQLIGRGAADGSVLPSTLKTTTWKTGDVKRLPLELAILTPRLESELTLQIKITSVATGTGGTTTDVRFAALEVVAVPDAMDPEVLTLAYKGDQESIARLKGMSLRSVSALDGQGRQDYVAIQPSGDNVSLVLLQEADGYFKVSRTAVMPAVKGDLLALHRVDADQNGKPDYVLVWRLPPSAGKKQPTFLFRFFNLSLEPSLEPTLVTFDGKTASEAEFSNSVSVINDQFRWMRLGKQLVPTWVARGTTPEGEKPIYDPWDPTPLDLPDFRLYYWGPAGLKTLRLDGQTPIATMQQSRADMQVGRVRVIWTKGNGSNAAHSMTTIENAEFQNPVGIQTDGFRQLRSNAMAPILNGDGEILGTGFSSDSYRSAIRFTGIFNDGRSAFDHVIEPLSKADSVLSVLGGFIDSVSPEPVAGITSQTIYEMQYTDLKSGDVSTTSLRRFSFLPGFFFLRLNFPVVGESSATRSRIPMIYLSAGLGTSSNSEIIAPRYENGKLTGLVRPARLRFTAPDGCDLIGNAVESSQSTPSQIGFFCADRIMFAPLRY